MKTQHSIFWEKKTGGGKPACTSPTTPQCIQQEIQGQDTDCITFPVTPDLKTSENTQFRHFPNRFKNKFKNPNPPPHWNFAHQSWGFGYKDKFLETPRLPQQLDWSLYDAKGESRAQTRLRRLQLPFGAHQQLYWLILDNAAYLSIYLSIYIYIYSPLQVSRWHSLYLLSSCFAHLSKKCCFSWNCFSRPSSTP